MVLGNAEWQSQASLGTQSHFSNYMMKTGRHRYVKIYMHNTKAKPHLSRLAFAKKMGGMIAAPRYHMFALNFSRQDSSPLRSSLGRWWGLVERTLGVCCGS